MDDMNLPDGVRVVPGGFEIPCSKKTQCPQICFAEEIGGAIISDKGHAVLFESDEQLDALEALLAQKRLARAAPR